jgi:hypothetical protein
MPSYDDDMPTQEEEILLKQLVENGDEQQRIRAIIQVKKTLSSFRGAISNFMYFPLG